MIGGREDHNMLFRLMAHFLNRRFCPRVSALPRKKKYPWPSFLKHIVFFFIAKTEKHANFGVSALIVFTCYCLIIPKQDSDSPGGCRAICDSKSYSCITSYGC